MKGQVKARQFANVACGAAGVWKSVAVGKSGSFRASVSELFAAIAKEVMSSYCQLNRRIFYRYPSQIFFGRGQGHGHGRGGGRGGGCGDGRGRGRGAATPHPTKAARIPRLKKNRNFSHFGNFKKISVFRGFFKVSDVFWRFRTFLEHFGRFWT